MERIYTAIDADELQKLLDEGFILQGVFGNTKKDMEKNGVWQLGGIDEEYEEQRFHVEDYGTPYAFFKLTDVQSWKAYDQEETEDIVGMGVRLKHGMTLQRTEFPAVFKVGSITVTLHDLFRSFEFMNGSPIGKKRSIPWKVQ